MATRTYHQSPFPSRPHLAVNKTANRSTTVINTQFRPRGRIIAAFHKLSTSQPNYINSSPEFTEENDIDEPVGLKPEVAAHVRTLTDRLRRLLNADKAEPCPLGPDENNENKNNNERVSPGNQYKELHIHTEHPQALTVTRYMDFVSSPQPEDDNNKDNSTGNQPKETHVHIQHPQALTLARHKDFIKKHTVLNSNISRDVTTTAPNLCISTTMDSIQEVELSRRLYALAQVPRLSSAILEEEIETCAAIAPPQRPHKVRFLGIESKQGVYKRRAVALLMLLWSVLSAYLARILVFAFLFLRLHPSLVDGGNHEH